MRTGARGPGPPAPVVAHLAWATFADVVPGDAWLSAGEREALSGIRFAKRAADWRLGRWVAKRAVAAALPSPALEAHSVEVLPAPGGGPAPRVLAPGAWPPLSLSLSHSGGVGFAAAAVGVLRLGCDVETVAPRSELFVTDYLTPEEAEWVRLDPGDMHVRANLVWSAKESALKALGHGLRVDTRSVQVTAGEGAAAGGPAPEVWRPLEVRSSGGDLFRGWWRREAGAIWTVVADCPLVLDSDR